MHVSDDLRSRRSMHGDSAPESAPLLLPYGKALVEIAIENQGVLGKEEPEKENDEGQEEGEQSCLSFQAVRTGESRSMLTLPGMTLSRPPLYRSWPIYQPTYRICFRRTCRRTRGGGRDGRRRFHHRLGDPRPRTNIIPKAPIFWRGRRKGVGRVFRAFGGCQLGER